MGLTELFPTLPTALRIVHFFPFWFLMKRCERPFKAEAGPSELWGSIQSHLVSEIKWAG